MRGICQCSILGVIEARARRELRAEHPAPAVTWLGLQVKLKDQARTSSISIPPQTLSSRRLLLQSLIDVVW